MLDADLAELYGVTTGNLNKAVQRNLNRFPSDFMFQLSATEFEDLKFQNGRSSLHGGRRTPPFAFTQAGIAMMNCHDHLYQRSEPMRFFVKCSFRYVIATN